MGPLWRPLVYLYIWAHYGGPIVYICMGVYMGVYIWAHYGVLIVYIYVYMGVVFYK